MAFIKAFAGAIDSSLADQWKDFYTVPSDLKPTVGVAPAVHVTQNEGRGSNTKSSADIITNGSLILVPEGFALITLENGQVTGYVDEPGGYEWTSDNLNSRSFLSGDGVRSSLIKQTWERFKFGGMPYAAQLAVFVNLKEIPNNKFGTQSTIYWDDAYLGTQVGSTARGTYSLRIANPILFLKNYLPAEYYSPGMQEFDFSSYGNAAVEQLFNEVVGSLAAAFSGYANADSRANRILSIQRDSLGFAHSLSKVLEENYRWLEDRGLEIVKAAVIAIDYDAETKELIRKVQQADALMGARGNSNLQASFAQGIAAAGENPDGGALGMAFMGMGFQGLAGSAASLQQNAPNVVNQQPVGQPVQAASSVESGEDPYERLIKLKDLLDKGIITQNDFDAAKAKVLAI